MYLSEIVNITAGRLVGNNNDRDISDFITDSRHAVVGNNVAFIAIVGKNHNGHTFIPYLYNRGVRVFVVEQFVEHYLTTFPESSFIVVSNSLLALQQIARQHRLSFSIPTVAITGSAGKTIVKEWIADIAGLSLPIVRSPKSYNSQVGVPLSVFYLSSKYRLAIFEAGISMPGEMSRLEWIINPDMGVLTNIGDAHGENFISLREKTEEKLKLFVNCKQIVFCKDQTFVDEIITSKGWRNSKEIIDWSRQEDSNAAVFVKSSENNGKGTRLTISFKRQNYTYIVPFDDIASVENAITAAVVLLAMDIPQQIIAKGLSQLTAVAMRMDIKEGINGCQLIEDYYNSDLGSLRVAIESLRTISRNRRKTVILSDFMQSGLSDHELYTDTALMIERAGIDRFIGIGQRLKRFKELFATDSLFYETTEEFLENLNKNQFSKETILIKGARVFEFEKIGVALEQLAYQTLLEVNLDAVANNLSQFRQQLNPSTKIMVMVKAFAYGTGAAEIAEFIEYHGVDYLGVANVDEGVELRNAGVVLPIIVMNPDPASLEIVVRYNLEPVIYNNSSLLSFLATAQHNGLIHYPIHIEIDTGMHRLGFLHREINSLLQLIANDDRVKIASVFSHFAASEDSKMDSFTHSQAEKFIDACKAIEDGVKYKFIRHICNSAGVVRFHEYHFDMVRMGIGVYMAGLYEGIQLQNVSTFKTKILQVKQIPSGESVGYNCRDISDSNRTIAILPVGYADGLNRLMGNRRGSVYVNGSKVPILGNVCMDACMIDITGLNVAVGDEVEIFGEHIDISELAQICNTIPYEILTSIPHRVKRVFYKIDN